MSAETMAARLPEASRASGHARKEHTVMMVGDIQYISDENGQPVGVIALIELWREIESERETACLLKSAALKRRLVEAKERRAGISLEEACEKLGI